MKTTSSLIPSALAALVVGVLGAGSAQAALIERVRHQNAGSFCQGALPAFAGTLRTRPLGVGNEGGVPAFLTCSFSSVGGFGTVNRVSTWWTNNTGANITINCTGVFGFQRSTPVYLPKSAVVAPGANVNIAWTDADNGGSALPQAGNTSCELPPGAVLLDTYVYYDVEIGA